MRKIMNMEHRINRLQCRLKSLREICQHSGRHNDLVFEDAISDLTTLIQALEDERRKREV